MKLLYVCLHKERLFPHQEDKGKAVEVSRLCCAESCRFESTIWQPTGYHYTDQFVPFFEIRLNNQQDVLAVQHQFHLHKFYSIVSVGHLNMANFQFHVWK